MNGRSNKNTLASNTVCVIVTYADRQELLLQVIQALMQQGVLRAVVVDNGSYWPVRQNLVTAFGDWVDVVEVGRNAGSACGFAMGIERAMALGAELIWLLDDDNRPRDHCLQELLNARAQMVAEGGVDVAVAAFRGNCQAQRYIASGIPHSKVNARHSSFMGFHVLDIPRKLWRRLPVKYRRSPHRCAHSLLQFAPYGGLLIHRDTVQKIGLPRRDFVLYSDDKEYTFRIVANGGSIALVPSALLEDLESSWNVQSGNSSSLTGLLTQGGDFRAFYSARNGAYFSAKCFSKSRLVFEVNYRVFLVFLAVMAIKNGKLSRYRLLRKAYRDGLSSSLGPDRRFPLL